MHVMIIFYGIIIDSRLKPLTPSLAMFLFTNAPLRLNWSWKLRHMMRSHT